MAISRGLHLSFLNACLLSLRAKEYYRLIFIPIIQNISHYGGGLPLLENTTNAFSESLYFVVRPYIGPIFSLYRPYISPIFSLRYVTWLAGLLY